MNDIDLNNLPAIEREKYWALRRAAEQANDTNFLLSQLLNEIKELRLELKK